MAEKTEQTGAGRGRRAIQIASVFAVAALAGLAGIYGIANWNGNAVEASCKPAAALAARLTPLMRGEVAALAPAKHPIRLANLTFLDAKGQPRSLADWKGRTVLLNLWATWCVPCKTEMPALDALQQKLGGPQFEVVAVNIDTRNPEKAKAWLKDAGIEKLGYYADPQARIFQDLKVAGRAFGMPTTILVDASGCEVATIAGPAEWASGDAVKLIEAAIRP